MIDGYVLDENLLTKDGTKCYVSNDNEDDFFDVIQVGGQAVIQVYKTCERVATAICPFNEEDIKTTITGLLYKNSEKNKITN